MAMDEPVRLIYRQLVRTGFEYAGSIENPSIFLDSLEEGIRICDAANRGYMHIYIDIEDGVIKNIRYLCSCDPTANVVVETMCDLLKGKNLEEAKRLSEEDFYAAIGSCGEMLVKRVRGIIELINRGIAEYETETPVKSC
jgi:NifU-like protein involved in Fe-S cluster formation